MKEKRSVVGVGINDYPDCEKHIRSIWNNMLERCYSQKVQTQNPTYMGCSVDPVWHKLSEFRKWFLQSNYKPGLQLDKDITNIGNKIYGPDNCSFVSGRINKLIIDRGNARGLYKVGVCFHKSVGKFSAQCNINGKLKHIGYYNTEEEAFQAYKSVKETQIKIVAVEEYVQGNCTLEVRDALMEWEI